ncbi:MAG: type II toxin-antitoxin system RatA family toxin [Rhodospirillales bacterium]
MPSHAERKTLPFSREQLFDLVADVDKYPEFLPWCVGMRVRSKTETMLVADMMIGFKAFREVFTSRVALQRPDRVDVSYEHGPFKYLTNRWIFEVAGNETTIDFHVDFEFRSKILEKAIGAVFTKAVERMVAAFENRAHELYG